MSKTIKRDFFIDSMRGLMLVIMALDHTPFFTKRYTYHTFGFFGAAMGFIFLSGYVFGFVYSRYLDTPDYLIKKTFKRIWLIYKYHIGLFLFVLLLNFILSTLLDEGPLNPDFPSIIDSASSIIKFSLLLNQPGGFDILPLYIFLLAISPFILIGFKKGYARQILISSFIIWLGIQIPTVQQLNESIQSYLNIDLGFFNIFAWQFLFFTGLFLGFNRNQNIQFVKYNNTFLWIAFFVLGFFFLVRQIGPSRGWHFVSKFINERSYLSAPRLLNFLIFIYFMGGISKHLIINKINFLAFLGKYSIDVFVFHIPLTFLMLKYSSALSGLNKPIQVLLAFCLVISLAIPAKIKEEFKKKGTKSKGRMIILPDKGP